MALVDKATIATRKYLLPTVIDNIYNSNALFVRFRNKKMLLDGGSQIEQPVLYDKPTAQTFSGYDTLNMNPVEDVTAAYYNWAMYQIPVMISGTEDLNNSGKYAMINQLTLAMQNAEQGLKDKMGTDLFAASTGANDIVGILAFVDDGTNTATYGSINRTTYTWWASKYGANGGTGRQLTAYLLQNMFGQCTIDNQQPDLLVTDQAVSNKLLLMQDGKQFFTQDTSNLAPVSFQNLVYKGRPVLVDSHITTPSSNSQIYFLNERTMTFYVHKDCDFFLRPFREPFNQFVIGSQIMWRGQLVGNQPRLNGRLVDIDATL